MKEEILLGSLMGDTNIYRYKNKYYHLSIEHCIEQEKYAIWKKDNLGINTSLFKRDRLDKRTNKTYYSCIVHKSSKDYEKYYNMFYTPKKEVSNEILDKLTDLSVAIWYCDDGWFYQNEKNRCTQLGLATNSFSIESIERIIEWFKKKYNINFSLVKRNKSIRLTSKEEIKKFLDIFGKRIPECMNYKKGNI